MLPLATFALCRFNDHPGAGHPVSQAAQRRVDPPGAEHRVADVVPVDGRQAVTGPFPYLLVGYWEDHELQFGADVGLAAGRGQPVE